MAPHFSILAWKIPWMEEPGGLQSMGSQRVGYDQTTDFMSFPGGSDGKESAYNVGDTVLIPGLGRPSGEENGNRLSIHLLMGI